MKILIALVVVALIYFLYRRFSAGSPAAPAQDATSDVTPEPSSPTAPSTSSATTQQQSSAPAPVAEVTETTQAAALSSAASQTDAAEAHKTLPLEHLVSINRSTGATLRALGVSDLASLAGANTETLIAAGFEGATANNLKAQAALSALPGVSPHELMALAASGVDSVASLAKEQPQTLAARIEKSNRDVGSLKSGLGIQQLQRIIGAANATANAAA